MLGSHAQQQIGATTPGVTVWAWQLEGNLETFPIVTENQTPNAYFVSPQINLIDRLESQEGGLSDRFFGEVRGWIEVSEAGQYEFRLEADDGGRLYIGDELIIDVERDSDPNDRFIAMGSSLLGKGLNAFRVPFYENSGNFYVRLKWKKPGASNWEVIPESNLKTEAGQTFVVSPGVKAHSIAANPFRPGDRRPLQGVHPAYTLENFRGDKFQPAVGGMCFIPDGRLAVCTWDPDGAVYLMDLNKSPVEVKKFASGLGEPLGIAWFDNHLLVTQKGEVTRLVDVNNDDVADRYEVVASGWPVSHNYHEFTFNLVPMKGKLYVTSSVPLRGGWTNYMPGTSGSFAVSNGPGRWIEIDPKSGAWKALANGLRTPNGMNLGVDGHMFVCDNQGSWMPSSRMNLLRSGGFYGHQENPDDRVEMDPPVVWFPQGEIGNSPSQMVLVPDGAYRGQMLVGDVTHGGIKRVFVEKVDGIYQGTVFRFSQGIEAGVNRLTWGPDGCLYVGGIGSNGNWNHENTKFGLQRLRYNDHIPFEMKSVQSRKGGLLVSFTEPVDVATFSGIDIQQFRYEQSEFYGGPKIDLTRLQAGSMEWRNGNTQAFLPVDGLKSEHIVYLRWKGLKSLKGQEMWSTEAWMTQNRLSQVSISEDGNELPKLPLEIKRPKDADVLVDGRNVNMVLAGAGPNRWEASDSALWADPSSGDMKSRNKFEDVYLHVEWFSPHGGARSIGGKWGDKDSGPL